MRATERLPGPVFGAFVLSVLAVTSLAAQSQVPVDLAVKDPRPLGTALFHLEKLLGWVLTYEDPEWVYAGDLQDRSALTGTPYNPEKPQPMPRGGAFTFSATTRLDEPEGKLKLIQTLLHDYHLSPDHQGEFKVIQTADALHIVPAQAKNAQGKLEPRTSILDTPIHLAPGTRTAAALMTEFTTAVSAATGKKVEVFFLPMNLFWRAQVTIDERPTDSSARAMLSHILKATGRKMSWSLVYLPDSFQGYALSLYEVR